MEPIQNDNNKPMTLYPELILLMGELFAVQAARKATVFIEVSGHVSMFAVRIHRGSWGSMMSADFTDDVYIEEGLEDNQKFIDSFVNRVRSFITNL